MHEFQRNPDGSTSIIVEGREPIAIRHIIGIGRNYAAHADEQGAERPERPMLFTKNPASIALPGEDIVIPAACQDREQVDYEGELAVIIASPARDVGADEFESVLLGYCVANDVSARWWQKKGAGGQFHRGKSFDTFCPLGPGVIPVEQITDPQSLTIETTLNGEIVQSAPTSQMIFPVSSLIEQCSRGMTLLPGTVILTGTPAGVGMAQDPQRFLREGDTVKVSIEGLGTISSSVRLQ
jgi:2-keto-4-pentenoate hydratase/2-oxohepta-3-ene-1,7-dioic acid hydratase in catechol pathway